MRQNVISLLLLVTACVTSLTAAFLIQPTTHRTMLQNARIVRFMSSGDVKKPSSVSTEKVERADDDNDIPIEKVEALGRGSAKAKRGKRKGAPTSTTPDKSKVKIDFSSEEVFYEGPPAITETIVPTISILTVIGIVPAAAAWARQAWVRYKITTRRIRVTSGVGGKDVAEIVYPDIVELRTAKRLFGDGDLVAFLRDGAKLEMRNVPNFEETVDFIVKQLDPKVASKYREKGDVTKP